MKMYFSKTQLVCDVYLLRVPSSSTFSRPPMCSTCWSSRVCVQHKPLLLWSLSSELHSLLYSGLVHWGWNMAVNTLPCRWLWQWGWVIYKMLSGNKLCSRWRCFDFSQLSWRLPKQLSADTSSKSREWEDTKVGVHWLSCEFSSPRHLSLRLCHNHRRGWDTPHGQDMWTATIPAAGHHDSNKHSRGALLHRHQRSWLRLESKLGCCYTRSFCEFCLSRILHYFTMLVCQSVCHRRDISSYLNNLLNHIHTMTNLITWTTQTPGQPWPTEPH